MRACRHPRCPKPSINGTPYCETHQQPERAWRPDKRLSAAARGYDAAWGKTRLRVIWRDQVCAFCGDSVIGADNRPAKGATVHHIIPRDEGGSDELDNLAACHKPCHERHHGRLR